MPVLDHLSRLSIGGVLTASALGGAAAALLAGPAAMAAPDTCAASAVAKTIATVATNTGAYLDSHPETNQALTAISKQPAGAQSLLSLKAYFDANPQAGKDLQTIQQPLTSLSTKCKLPVSLPQLLGLMQAAQQGGGGTGQAGTVPMSPSIGSAVSALP